MKVDYIRREIPEEISEQGGAFIQLVGKSTVGLKQSIKEAIAHLYCVGEESMIEGYFKGIMRSVFEGIKEDGHARSVGDIQFYPVCGGQFDLERGWDPYVNDVRIKCRLINGVTLDVSDWSFRDVTEGRVAFTVENVGDGTLDGVVTTNKNTEVNGRNFPAKELMTIEWACGVKSGTVAQNQFSATVSRITIDKAAYSTLTDADDGKEITLTFKGCYNKVMKKAVVAYKAPNPAFTSVTIQHSPGVGYQINAEGANFRGASESPHGTTGHQINNPTGRLKDGSTVLGLTCQEALINEFRNVFDSLWVPESVELVDGKTYTFEFDFVNADGEPCVATATTVYHD